MKINLEQKKSLSNFSGNLSIAWFAAGIIGPIVTRQNLYESGGTIAISLFVTILLFIFMLKFIGTKNRKSR